MAGVAMASAGILAVTPVTPTPATPDVREAAVELAAIANPLTVLQQTITNTLVNLNSVSTQSATASTALIQALSNPALQAELADFVVGTATNPLTLLTELANFPANYGDRITAALTSLLTAQQGGFANLPTALASSLAFLAQGEFLEAFSELNVFLLVDILSDGRETLLDAFKIPGEFAASIGADPLARVFNALITRGVAGNLGRALLAPQVTAIIQTAEILDRTRAALLVGDFATVIGELINAPARIANAFINGYVPEFTTSPEFPAQAFPGLLSPRGTFDFFFVQLPTTLAAALTPPVAPTAAPTPAPGAVLASASVTDLPLGGPSVLLTTDAVTPAAETEPAGPTDDAAPIAPVEVQGDDGDDGTFVVDETDAPGDDATGDDAPGDDAPGDDAPGDDDTATSTRSTQAVGTDDDDDDRTKVGTSIGTSGNTSSGATADGGASSGGASGGSASGGGASGGSASGGDS